MISFFFTVNKAFLEYPNQPITIPKEHHSCMIEEIYGGKGNRTIPVRIIPTKGRNLYGEIYYGRAGYGPYYQIKILGNYPGYYFSDLSIGELVLVTLKRIGNKIDVKIHSTAELQKKINNLLSHGEGHKATNRFHPDFADSMSKKVQDTLYIQKGKWGRTELITKDYFDR